MTIYTPEELAEIMGSQEMSQEQEEVVTMTIALHPVTILFIQSMIRLNELGAISESTFGEVFAAIKKANLEFGAFAMGVPIEVLRDSLVGNNGEPQ